MHTKALAVLALLVAACGGTSTPATDVVIPDLVGDWDNGTLFLQIAADGSYQVLESADSDPGDPLMGGFVARAGEQLSFVTHMFGPCAGETGVYGALLAGDVLELALVDDPCSVRVEGFLQPFDRS